MLINAHWWLAWVPLLLLKAQLSCGTLVWGSVYAADRKTIDDGACALDLLDMPDALAAPPAKPRGRPASYMAPGELRGLLGAPRRKSGADLASS